MRWVEISRLSKSSEIEKVKAVLARYGQGGIVSERSPAGDERLKIYLARGRRYPEIKLEIEEALAKAGLSIDLVERAITPEEWLAPLKADFKAQNSGKRLRIEPSWAVSKYSRKRIVVRLDPGAAFGAGDHPTTRLCLTGLERYVRPGMSVLDVGTGTGILAIAAAKLGASRVLALDTDSVAVKAARANATANGVRVNVWRGTLSRWRQRRLKSEFDLVLANVYAQAIMDLAAALAAVLRPGGILIVSGIHAEQVDRVMIALGVAGLRLDNVQSEAEWVAVVATKEKEEIE